jgi:hypothetical protein
MEELQPRLTVQDALGYTLAYGLWLVVAAIGMLAILQLRHAFNAVWPVISDNNWLLRAFDRFGLVFLGLAWLVYVIFVEQYYRTSITLVRERRFRIRTGSPRSSDTAPQSSSLRALRQIGLDVLVQRLVPTAGGPLAVLIVGYGLYRLAWWLLLRYR